MADSKRGSREGLTRRELLKTVGGGTALAGLSGAAAAGAAAPKGAAPIVLGPGKVKITLRVNGTARVLEVEPRTTLLEALRTELQLTGAKLVCDRGACGACTVLLSGEPVNACLLFAIDAIGSELTTIEGIAHGAELSPLQRAFCEQDALQCGFCTPGMVMSCSALLRSNDNPTASDVQRAIAGNLCRCGTYPNVIAATLAAAAKKRGRTHG